MKRQRLPGTVVATLLTAVLISGCTFQDQSEGEPTPASSSQDEAHTAIGDPVSGTYKGTQTIELGAPSEETTRISVELLCLSPGTIFLPGGAETTCKEDGSERATSRTSFQLPAGQDAIEVRTSDPNVRYELKVVYKNK